MLKRTWQELSKETIPNLFSIKDKIIIISGAGRGIGRYLAHSMAKHSAFVYCIDKKFPKEVPKDVKKNMFNVKCDITNNHSFMKVCQNIFKTSKKIDVLINNAGVTFPSNKKEVFYPTKNWNDTLKLNLTASFHCSQAVIKYMIKNKSGSIINITSINAELAFPKNPAYIASKGGLKMLGKSLAKDWGRFGIRVNNL